MRKIWAQRFACIVFSALSSIAPAIADDGGVQNLKWAGRGPLSETRVIEADCGDAQYTVSILQERRERPNLTELERSPISFSTEVREQLSLLVREYLWIENFILSCGSGPTDYAHNQENTPNPFKNFPDQDFTGELRVEIIGTHSVDTKEAKQDCLAKDGDFSMETRRVATLSSDEIEIDPGTIGRCIDVRGKIKLRKVEGGN